jgi:hypothetical protein
MKPEDMNFELLGPGVHTEGAQSGRRRAAHVAVIVASVHAAGAGAWDPLQV